MKKLLILIFSLFLLGPPPIFADDISDFQIEGISIGDSLLDYMTEDEILEEIERTKDMYPYLEPNKYAPIYFRGNSSTYVGFSFFIKKPTSTKYITNKNEKYIILSIRGMMNYIEDFDGCLQKRDEIVEVLSEMFPNIQKYENTYSHAADPSGNSINDDVYFEFNSGDSVDLTCNNFEENFRNKMKWTEGLDLVIRSKEIVSWLENKI